MDDILLQDVSFDQVLSSFSSNKTTGNDLISLPEFLSEPKHKALVQPDQVPRLPHLSIGRRDICQDQVDAYYSILKEEPVTDPRYKRTLESLDITLAKALDRPEELATDSKPCDGSSRVILGHLEA
ncbi:hypothetical protein MMC19_004715 [Ptychographa xylographoides]|nr:hypothetical protein [Ptychographa xylographoides]